MIRKPIPGYEGYYEVSDTGRVFGVDRILNHGRKWRGTEIKSKINAHGYSEVSLNRNGEQKSIRTHILVMLAFVGSPPNGMECRHKDGNGGNPTLTNLMWGTHMQNYDDQIRHGSVVRGERVGNSKLTAAQAVQIAKVKAWPFGSKAKMARKLGISNCALGDILKGRSWTHETGIPGLQYFADFEHNPNSKN